tara:strand:+ start:158 stop:1039 length:882 start_codon:yes stop_codon:yes gene_type:complete
MDAIRERILRTSGLTFTAIEAGEGPTILCLHGFPDTRHTYEGVARRWAEAGYRVVAPQLRGYEHSSDPGNGDFYLETLATDVIGWIEELGDQKVHLVGHDWGAPIAYAAAALAPARISTVTAMSVPHLRHFRERIWRTPSQFKRSWYMAFFQLRGIAERTILSDRVDFIRRLMGTWSPNQPPPETWFEQIDEVFSDPILTKNTLGYYRCAFDWRQGPGRRSLELARRRPSVPVLSLVGAHDGCMAPEVFEGVMEPSDFQEGLTHRRIPGAGHFLHLDQPEIVAGTILEFIKDR